MKFPLQLRVDLPFSNQIEFLYSEMRYALS
jgi:hypothetical protein